MRVCFFTLGCKVNQNETNSLMQLFFENGFDVVDNQTADIYVVNSCTVTSTGDKKSLQWLRRAKRDNPNAITVLTGCYPQAFPDKAKECGADIVTGNTNRNNIIAHIKKHLLTKKQIVDIQPHIENEHFEQLPTQTFSKNTRAFMKIQDGCNRQCAYCIIPTARGRVRSLSVDQVIKSATQLVKNGYKEIVFTGINLSCYGIDIGTDFAQIMQRISEISGLERIRLGSIEPDLLPYDTLVALSKIEKLCPQFHLSLQSGCDKTLKSMNRMYTSDEYFTILSDMKKLFKNATFTTDVIVGFPQETEQDFEQSVEFVEKCKFLKVHVFSYSIREGTKAAEMPNQIDSQTKQKRSKILTQRANTVRENLLKEMVNTTESVLLEKPLDDGTFTGYTKTYVPVLVKAPNHKQGDIVSVKLVEFENNKFTATLI